MSYSLTLSHVGVFVTDMPRMVDFYTRFMGFVVSDRGVVGQTADIVFLTRNPTEHHQLVFVAGRPAGMPFNPINQLSFRVDGASTLQSMYRRLKDEPVTEVTPVSHGNALSVYFRDPEGNRVELLVDTPWYIPQPHRVPVDLELPVERLWQHIEAQVRGMPGFKARGEWALEMRKRIDESDARRPAAHVD
jgi:catechol 2,3-dioxygenase-like lactoylglutathione lyase family enzyme